MKNNEIKLIANKNGWNFEIYHDFSGICDRYRYNRNVLVTDKKPGYRIVCTDKRRSKWVVTKLIPGGNAIVLMDPVSLIEAINFA